MNKESYGHKVFVVDSEHDVILRFAIGISPLVLYPKNFHISPVHLRNAGRISIWQVMLLWQEGHTPVLTHVLSHSYKRCTQNLFVCSIEAPYRCCLLTEALGKLSSGRKTNHKSNCLQVKSIMLFSARPLGLIPPPPLPKFFQIDAVHMRNCAELF